MLPIINILLIVGILLFILYNLYVDTRNWSNTGSFLEGMENAGESIDIPVGNSNTNTKTVTLPHQNMTVSPTPINEQHPDWRDTFRVSVSGNQLSVTRTDAGGGWGQQLVLKGTVGQNGNSNYEYAQKRYCNTYDSYSRHTVPVSATQSKEKGCELKCNELGDNCNVMAAGDGTENGISYNCTTYKNCALSAPGTSSWWTSGSGTTGGNFEYYKKIHRAPAAPAAPAASNSSPLAGIGKLVTYEMLTDKSDFCGDGSNKTTKMVWTGEVCEGGKIKWNSMKSLAGTTRDGFPQGCSWNREGKSDAWITKYVGSCGVSPTYVSLPTTVTELESAAPAPTASGAQGDCERDDPSKVTGVKLNGGDFPWDGTKSQEWNVNNQKQICEQELGKCFKHWEADGKQGPWCYEKSSTGAGSLSGAGSAETAMDNEIRERAGNVAPMDSNVPQNCKPGCVPPTGPFGNCKVVQDDSGKEMRECPYKCENSDFDSTKCQYNQDCNACGTKMFDPNAPSDMSAQQSTQRFPGQMAQGQMAQGQMGQMAQGQMAQGQMAQGQMAQGQMTQGQMGQMGQMAQGQMTQGQMGQMAQGQMGQMNQPGSMSNSVMDYNSGSAAANVGQSNFSLFNEDIMKQVLANKDLIPSDINLNNEETSFNSRIGKKFMIDTANIRNFALPNIDEQDYIELGRIVKKIKMIEKDPRDSDQVKTLYSKLNVFVLELLTDSSLDCCGYDNTGIPKQINNKTRTTGMFGENSNSLIRGKRQKVKPYNSIWSLYQ